MNGLFGQPTDTQAPTPATTRRRCWDCNVGEDCKTCGGTGYVVGTPEPAPAPRQAPPPQTDLPPFQESSQESRAGAEVAREQLLRVHRPGTNACIHIQQLLAYVNQHGFMGRRDFRGAMIDVFTARHSPGQFRFVGEFVIPKDPQAMAQRLNLHSLQFKTGYGRDAQKLAPAVNDYVLIFQKPGDNPNPVRSLYHAEKNPEGWVSTEEWIRWASGVWDDIDEFDIIDGARSARESTEEKHVCPLQLEVIRRLVRLYSNPSRDQPDVLVMDPFMGVGSTAAVCVELGRNAIGFELKESYHANALKNVARAEKKRDSAATEDVSLFAQPTAAGGAA